MTVLLGTVVIDPQRGVHGVVRQRQQRLTRELRVRRLVYMELAGRQEGAGGAKGFWYPQRRLRVVGNYAVVMAAKPKSVHVGAKSSGGSSTTAEAFERFLGTRYAQGGVVPLGKPFYVGERKAA